jgi:capsid protein
MSFFDFLNKKNKYETKKENEISCYVSWEDLLGGTFDGEIEPGALSDQTILYDVDYYEMARRAYTLVTTNEFAKILVSRLTQFVVGTGLQLHPEPMLNFLRRKLKINLPETFGKDIKELWNLIEDDEMLSQSKDQTIHSLAKDVFYNGFIAGDVLVVKRVVNQNLEYQIINGLSVYSVLKVNPDNGNKIIDGVEIDENNVPVGYWIKQKNGMNEIRLDARDKKGRLLAWLVPVGEKRINATRAYSKLGVIMQKLHKIGRYANAEVIAAETNSKFAAVIEQSKDSSGVNPLANIGFKTPALPRGFAEKHNLDQPQTDNGEIRNRAEQKRFNNFLQRVKSGIFFQTPIGQKMTSFDTKRPNVNYVGFLDGSNKYMFASDDMPIEIAILQFSNNFSASRASLKMFEQICKYIQKTTIIDRFYVQIYKQHFELWCLKGDIFAPKYLQLKDDTGFIDNAYTKCKFVGQKIPHIDEVKEVNAVVAKLKSGLCTYEQALENLGNTTDFDTLIQNRKAEEEKIRHAGLNFDTLFAPDNPPSNDEDTESSKEKRK